MPSPKSVLGLLVLFVVADAVIDGQPTVREVRGTEQRSGPSDALLRAVLAMKRALLIIWRV
jgi:hypothetical protein